MKREAVVCKQLRARLCEGRIGFLRSWRCWLPASYMRCRLLQLFPKLCVTNDPPLRGLSFFRLRLSS